MSVIYHKWDAKGVYISSREAQTDDKGRILGPGRNETADALPECGANEIPQRQDGAWVIVEDHRGTVVYNCTTRGKTIIADVGPIPVDYTETPPPEKFPQYYKCIDDVWSVDTSKKQEALSELIQKANAQIDATILNGIEYGGVRFFLTGENQRNYAELDRLRSELTYPKRVWCGENEHQIADAEEMHTFYLQGLTFINNTLEAGQDLKNTYRNMTTAEIITALGEL